jgi:hypothetical protein
LNFFWAAQWLLERWLRFEAFNTFFTWLRNVVGLNHLTNLLLFLIFKCYTWSPLDYWFDYWFHINLFDDIFLWLIYTFLNILQHFLYLFVLTFEQLYLTIIPIYSNNRSSWLNFNHFHFHWRSILIDIVSFTWLSFFWNFDIFATFSFGVPQFIKSYSSFS